VQIRAEHRQEPLVNIDSGRIRQVLINLIRNASEAMGGQGTIEVVVDASSHAATVTVRDSGPGIPQEVQDRIFEPFFTTKGERGLGLGLDISRQIVRAHGGSLVFTSERGVGSEFSVILPMQQDSDADEPRDTAPEFSDLATDAGHMRFPTT
jgi:two-component system NtrC family sensor kinase